MCTWICAKALTQVPLKNAFQQCCKAQRSFGGSLSPCQFGICPVNCTADGFGSPADWGCKCECQPAVIWRVWQFDPTSGSAHRGPRRCIGHRKPVQGPTATPPGLETHVQSPPQGISLDAQVRMTALFRIRSHAEAGNAKH